ncbi:MAG: GNAT family N-acetyltransferase [Bacteroidota bacterium]|nr:GNAT family N-acetyltransferase [Bacteroidota bacterium]
MNFSLVNATEADSEFVYQLKKTVLKEYVEKTWQQWDEAFQKRFHKENYSVTNTRIIKIDRNAIGTIDLKEGETSIFVSGLYILPEFQSKGIGSAILEQLLERAKLQMKILELEVLRVNINAQRFYKRLGFAFTGKDNEKYFLYKDFR